MSHLCKWTASKWVWNVSKPDKHQCKHTSIQLWWEKSQDLPLSAVNKNQTQTSKMSKIPSQHKPGLYPDNVNKLHFSLLCISGIHMNWVKENYRPGVKHTTDTFLHPQERKIFMSIPALDQELLQEAFPLLVGCQKTHFTNPWHCMRGLNKN